MESGYETARSTDHRDDCRDGYESDVDTGCGAAYGRHHEITSSRCVTPSLSENGHWMPSRLLPDGPIMQLPPDVWRLLMTHLLTSDAMSLRCTARAVQEPLKIVSDAILQGCRMIDRLMQTANLKSMCLSTAIDTLSTLRLEARPDIIARYARQVGMAYCVETGRREPNRLAFVSSLKIRYFTTRITEPGSVQAKSADDWFRLISMTKADLRDATFDASGSIALANLYAAEIYAPLLGLVSDPVAHIKRVMAEAFTHLSVLRWMDFLYALEPIKEVCAVVTEAFQKLAFELGRDYPQPRIEVLTAIVYASLTMIRHPKSVRERCLNQFGIDPLCVSTKLMPRLTRCVAESILFDPFLRGIDVAYRLARLVARWGDEDGSFAVSLHHAFVTGVARKHYRGSTPWKSLPEPVRLALYTRVLNIAPNESAIHGLSGRTIVDFWGLYFEVTGPNMRLLLPKVTLRIDALPWPLRATLWRLTADVHACPASRFRGYAHAVSHVLSFERIDSLCTRALDCGEPRFAIPALQATTRWQVAQAFRAPCLDDHTVECPSYAERLALIPSCPEYSPAAWAVLEGCTVAERLPLLATLFSYRSLLVGCDDSWPYESVVSSNVGAFLCNPTSSLVQPSREVANVLWHYFPAFREQLPERVLDPDGWECAFASRFDLTLSDARRSSTQ